MKNLSATGRHENSVSGVFIHRPSSVETIESVSMSYSSPVLDTRFDLRDLQRENEMLHKHIRSMKTEMEEEKKRMKTLEFICTDLEERLEKQAILRVNGEKMFEEEKKRFEEQLVSLEADRDVCRLKAMEVQKQNESVNNRFDRVQKELLSMQQKKYHINENIISKPLDTHGSKEVSRRSSDNEPPKQNDNNNIKNISAYRTKFSTEVSSRETISSSRPFVSHIVGETLNSYHSSSKKQIRRRKDVRMRFLHNLGDFFGL